MVMLALVGVLVVVCVLSIAMGSRDVSLETILAAITGGGAVSTDATVIAEMRVPRTLLGVTVGVALGLGGALLQAVTRNPLADPGVMGVNWGAAVAVVLGVVLVGPSRVDVHVWLAFGGAMIAVIVVHTIASFGREGATPVKLALAGAAVSAGLMSVTTAIVMTNVAALDQLRMWQVGSLAGRYMDVFLATAPFIVLAGLVGLAMGRPLDGLALGDDVATTLGQHVRRTRALLFVLIAVLCGAATAACGPIVFVGLVVPHIARLLWGPDHRWILPGSALVAPIVLLLADVVGRVVLPSGELQVGIVLGVLGAPVFIVLVRHRDMVEL
jgi:iron complex transport system permease protein